MSKAIEEMTEGKMTCYKASKKNIYQTGLLETNCLVRRLSQPNKEDQQC